MTRRSALSKLLFVVVVFAAVWAITILYWRATYRMPSGQDMAFYGLGLPLLIIGVVGIGARLNKGRQAKQATAAAPAPVETSVQAGSDDAELKLTLNLLDSSLRLPSGNVVEEVSVLALEEQRVGLHANLHFSNGTQAFASEVVAVTAERFDERLLPAEQSGELDDEHRRALLLAADALGDLMERHAVAQEAPDGGASNAAASAPFHLHWLLPERWEHAATALAAWLSRHMEQGNWQPGILPPRVVFIADAVQALAAVDELQTLLHRGASNDRHIVLACDSWLSQRTVAAWEDGGRLYGQKQPDGRIPGEGACALLLARENAADAEPAARIHRLVSARRPSSADQAAGRRDGTLVELLGNAREQTAEPGLEMHACALVSDADQRVSRMLEMISTAEQAWPDGDADGRCRHLGLANGESGAVLALCALAVAAAHSLQTLQPTFAVSLSDPWARAVVLVSPAVPLPESAEADDRLAA